MSLVSNISSVAYTTSLENDKLLGEPITGNFSVSASTRSTSTISQSFGEDLFPVAQYSVDNATWNDAGAVIYDSSGGSLYQATCYTNSTSLVIIAENYTGSPATFYYRAVLVSEL
jgi:hypothetical protein